MLQHGASKSATRITCGIRAPRLVLCEIQGRDPLGKAEPGPGGVRGQPGEQHRHRPGAGGIDKCSSEGMVFYDPTAPEDRRFRYAMRISDELKDTVVFSSPDGIHWRLTHKNVLTFTRPESGSISIRRT